MKQTKRINKWIIVVLTSMAKVESGKFIFKSVYFAVDLNTEIVFAGGQAKLSGFQFYFSKGDAAKFEEIMNNLIG